VVAELIFIGEAAVNFIVILPNGLGDGELMSVSVPDTPYLPRGGMEVGRMGAIKLVNLVIH
jgi:hypothetical protein